MTDHSAGTDEPSVAIRVADEFEKLLCDMRHGSEALMNLIVTDADPSAVWWCAERICEQAKLLDLRFSKLKVIERAA